MLLPKGTPYYASLVRQIIDADAAVDFGIPNPEAAKFVKVFIPSVAIRPDSQAGQAHSNAAETSWFDL